MKAAVLSHVIAGFILCAVSLTAQEPVVPKPEDPFAQCEDKLATKVAVNPKLTTPFFRKREMHYRAGVMVNDEGKLSSIWGDVTAEDRKKVEWTSNCYTSHQNWHRMTICDAEYDGKELRLFIWGGPIAYFGDLYLKIRGDQFTCAFDANYPTLLSTSTEFRITKKQLRAKTLLPKIGERYYAWLSIYRGLDVLLAHKDRLCAHLHERYRRWFGVEFEFLLYDVTSTYFEGKAEGNPKARRGYCQRPPALPCGQRLRPLATSLRSIRATSGPIASRSTSA